MSARRQKVLDAMEQCRNSQAEVEACAKEHALAHDKFNSMMVERPRKGRFSGTEVENHRLHALSAYEALLDSLRIHSDNLAHLAALKGTL
jgi:hypothetical protein